MFRTLKTALGALVVCGAATGHAATYTVSYGLDQQQTSTPPAVVSGSGGGSTWLIEAGPGYALADYTYYSCCNGDVRPTAWFECDDLVFSSAGSGASTATVKVNLFLDASVGGCTSTSVGLGVNLSGSRNLGTWDGGTEGCNSGQSSGIFEGIYGTSLQGVFSSGPISVPLDTPLTFRVTLTSRIGSYQNLGIVDARVALAGTDVAFDVFEVVDGPADLTANSAELEIADNRWFDPALSPVPPVVADAVLVQAAPNPFNPRTRIAFVGLAGRPTTVEVCDLRGRRLGVLYDGTATGQRQDATWDAGGLASGTYLVRISSGSVVRTTKLSLLR